MDEMWERAVETALEGERDASSVRNLTLDGTVKCIHGRLPPPSIFEKFPNLQQLSIANIGVSSLEQFPRLEKLEKLILSDNRIAGGLEFLVEAGLESLRDLDLSNNKIQDVIDLRPLAELRIVSLDLYECPVTRVKDYRSRVFGLIKSLKYLDKMDAEENERPESDDEDDEEEEDGEEAEEDDPGSGEIDGDGEERTFRLSNGHTGGSEGVVEVDEDEESDADEEETETGRGVNGVRRDGVGDVNHHSNGFIVEPLGEHDVEEDGEDEDDDDFVEEVDEEDDVVEVHDIEDSDDEEDGVDDDDEDDDDDDDDDEDDDEDEDDEEVDNEKVEFGEPGSSGRLVSTEGEIDAHEQGEDDADEDDDGETGEEEQGIEEGLDFDDEDDAEDEDEDNDSGFLVQPVDQGGRASGSVMEDEIEDDRVSLDAIEDEDDDDEDGEVQEVPEPPPAQKRKRDEEDSSGEDDAGESKSSKRRQ
ncbi:hypothetical protein Leryth_021278 [Lithospermum erythrorhizon]|nr:hypothetical protein Leryth_021278 [Lithospermum erythrorhizon]